MEKLTKDEAVRLHREMWDWIAKQEDAGSKEDRIITTGNSVYPKK